MYICFIPFVQQERNIIHFFFIKNKSNFAQAQPFYFFQQFEAQNVLILFLTAIYSFMVANRAQRPSGVYVYPVFSSKTCVHARHVILMVTVHVVVTVGVYLY